MTSIGEDMKQQEFVYVANAVKIAATTSELVISLLNANHRETLTYKHQETCTRMFIVAPFIMAKIWKPS